MSAVSEWPEPATAKPRQMARHIRDFANRPEPAWLVDGLIAEGQRAVIFGPPGVGKSWLAVDLAFSMAYHAPWLWQSVPHQRGVVMLDNEAIGDTLDRFESLEMYAGLSAVDRDRVPLLIMDEDVDLIRDASDLGEALGAGGWGVLIVDLASNEILKVGDDNSATDVAKYFEALKATQRAYAENVKAGGLVPSQLTIIGVMHSNRAGDLRGSLAISGSVDLTLSVQPTVDGFKVNVAKARRIRKDWHRFVRLESIPSASGRGESACCAVVDPPTRGSSGAKPLGANQRTVLATYRRLAGLSPDGVSADDIVDAAAKQLVGKQPKVRAQRALQQLLAGDTLVKDDDGNIRASDIDDFEDVS